MSDTSAGEGGMSDRDRTIKNRLESFSDIVIGFSLAQIAWNLVVPAHAADFVTRPVGIFAFLFTFGVVARFWWVHGEIFRNFFVPNSFMVVLNFVALSAIVLQVFALQLWVHFAPSVPEEVTAARIYCGVFAFTFASIALLAASGTWFRWAYLTPALRDNGIRRAITTGCVTVGLAIGVASVSGLGGTIFVHAGVGTDEQRVLLLPGQIAIGVLAGIVVGQLAAAIVKWRMKAS